MINANVALLILIAGYLCSFAFLLGNYEGHIAKAECEAALPRDKHCKLIAVPEPDKEKRNESLRSSWI